MFVSDTVTHQSLPLFTWVILSSHFIGLNHGVPETSIFLMQSSILYLIGAKFPRVCPWKAFIRPFPRPMVLHWGNDCLHGSFVAFFKKPHIPLTKVWSINKMRLQQSIVRKCRSRLHRVARKSLFLWINLDHSKNLRSVLLSVTLLNSHLQSILSVRTCKMVVWGSFRPFLSSLRTRGIQMPFKEKKLLGRFFLKLKNQV